MSRFLNIFLKHSRLNELIENYNIRNKKDDIEFIKNNTIIYSVNKKDFFGKKMLERINSLEFDFFIYSDYVKKENENTIINKKIFYKVPLDINNFEIIESKLSFISFVIYFDDLMINVAFKNNKYNYFITNNVFGLNFIKYFLKNHYCDFYDEIINKQISFSDLKISIIDNNANIEKLDSEFAIKICENSYEK